jgi:hypothetical protein
MRALSILVRNWSEHWVYASGINACTERSAHCPVSSKHAEHKHQELMRTLSIRVRNWCVHWACTSGTDAYPERMHQFLTLMLSISVKIPNWKGPFKTCWTSLYFSPKVTYLERLYGIKIMKIRAIENLTLEPLAFLSFVVRRVDSGRPSGIGGRWPSILW